jgi:predicted nucleic acid-binding protein
MASKIIMDANTLLDLSLERSDDYLMLRSIYDEIVSGTFKCYITTSIIHICGHWLKHYRDVAQAKRILLALLNDVRVIEASHEISVNAIHSDMTDIEDALQYYTALHHRLDCFISRDGNFKKQAKPELPIYHPKEFVKRFMN